ncbi:hypothetical protein D3C71_175220 [compost metagenome]
MQITSLQQLSDLVDDGVTVLVRRDPKVEMASVIVSGECFMSGNFWDFKPECHGGFHYDLAELHGRWNSAQSLADILATFLTTKGATNVQVIEEAYDWAAQFREKNEAMA